MKIWKRLIEIDKIYYSILININNGYEDGKMEI
jgi:hypothetical protein